MSDMDTLLVHLGERLQQTAQTNAVVGPTLTVGERHVVPLCELNLAIGGGTGSGADDSGRGHGAGGGAGGAAKATPVAVIVVEGGDVRLELLQ